MSFFNWTPDMSVGVDRIDEDHKGLISILNKLADSLEESQTLDDELINKCFLSLIRYTEVHFTREEEMLKAVEYPDLADHRKEHQVFIEEIMEMRETFKDAQEDTRRNLLNYLKGWLNSHILIEDMAYRPFVTNKIEARNAAECFAPLEVWKA